MKSSRWVDDGWLRRLLFILYIRWISWQGSLNGQELTKSPYPLMMLIRPGGKPVSLTRPANLSAVRGVISESYRRCMSRKIDVQWVAIPWGLLTGISSCQSRGYFTTRDSLEEIEFQLLCFTPKYTYQRKVPWYYLSLVEVEYSQSKSRWS